MFMRILNLYSQYYTSKVNHCDGNTCKNLRLTHTSFHYQEKRTLEHATTYSIPTLISWPNRPQEALDREGNRGLEFEPQLMEKRLGDISAENGLLARWSQQNDKTNTESSEVLVSVFIIIGTYVDIRAHTHTHTHADAHAHMYVRWKVVVTSRSHLIFIGYLIDFHSFLYTVFIWLLSPSEYAS